jgi:hypothetical protein
MRLAGSRGLGASPSSVRTPDLNWLWNQRPAASGDVLLTRGIRSGKPAKPGTKSRVRVIIPGG